MSTPQHSPIQIRPADPGGVESALQLVYQGLSPSLRQRQTAATLQEFRAQSGAANGLLTAWSGELLVGAILIQLQPGRIASLWPPHIVVDRSADPEAIAGKLLKAATELAVRGQTRMIQALLDTDACLAAERLLAAGFEHCGDLLYLVSLANAFPSKHIASGLKFEPSSGIARDRIASIVERTYAATRDCPRLNGVRPIAEVLEGYQAVGRFDPARWLLVRYGGDDVGCLLLANHAQHRLWELVYMGIVPEARGKGFGLAVTRHAQWLAGRGGAERLVLAVDAANEPAIKGYAAAGFATWDRRSVFIKVLT